MVIIINGSLGVGKTSVSWALMEKFEKSIMLDGDYIGAVHPFKIYDKNRVSYLYDTLAMLVGFHKRNGFEHFVINYVFESPNSLEVLKEKLKPSNLDIHVFWLTCSEEMHEQRIMERNNGQLAWELKRFKELNAIQRKASLRGAIGKEIQTDQLSIHEVADRIWEEVGG